MDQTKTDDARRLQNFYLLPKLGPDLIPTLTDLQSDDLAWHDKLGQSNHLSSRHSASGNKYFNEVTLSFRAELSAQTTIAY